MKNVLSFRIKYYILLMLQRFKSFTYFSESQLNPMRKKAFIFLAADYGNLGDVAITYAQTDFLKNNSDYQVIEIPISKSLEGLWFVKKHIQKDDIVTTVGGGNMGDLYDQIEYIRQLAIRFFPNNKFISFPQTFDFSETEAGKKALEVAKNVYSKHKNLIIIAREKISFDLMQKHFSKNTIILTPDIVLSLDKSENQSVRNGVVFCLRSDEEKSLSKEQNNEIIELAKTNYSSFEFYDTHIGRNNLSTDQRNQELNKIWNKFKGAELVITDRLHGMIFCYITNTPCIVFPNSNHKVKETVKWLPNNSNIILLESFSKEHLIDAIIKQKEYNGLYQPINKYQPLIDQLK